MPRTIEFETRLLLPFLFDHAKLNQFADHVLKIESAHTRLWRHESIEYPYTDNLLPYLRQFRELSSAADHGCYFVLEPYAARNLLETIEIPGADCQAQLIQRHGAELFLSPYGVAVFSLSIGVPKCDLEIEHVREFNRRMHFGKHWEQKTPERLIPIKSNLDRLPGTLRTPSLIDGLLAGAVPGGSMLNQLGIAEVNRSLSVYTVLRFPETVDFGTSETRKEMYNGLVGAASLWPTDHCGTNEDSDSSTLVLNNKHWLSVTSIGVAHFVADQAATASGEAAFNHRRVQNASDKLFFQYLHASLQRLAMHAFSREAIELTHDASHLHQSEFLHRLAPLKQTMIHFSLRGAATRLSEEVAATRFYQHCCRVFDLETEFNRLDKCIADAESVLRSFESLRQSKGVQSTLEEQIKLHEKVEWIEVIIVVVYSVEFAHILGDAFFPHDPTAPAASWIYPGLSLCAVALITMMSMMNALGLLSHASGNAPHPAQDTGSHGANRFVNGLINIASEIGDRMVGGKRRWAVVWILIAVGLHLAIGWLHSGAH